MKNEYIHIHYLSVRFWILNWLKEGNNAKSLIMRRHLAQEDFSSFEQEYDEYKETFEDRAFVISFSQGGKFPKVILIQCTIPTEFLISCPTLTTYSLYRQKWNNASSVL
jgi:hypothetical protein